MSKTLTIVINNIPEDQLKGIWEYGNNESKRSFGIELTPVDTIEVDFNFIADNYPENREILGQMVGGAITAHLIHEADKIMNP